MGQSNLSKRYQANDNNNAANAAKIHDNRIESQKQKAHNNNNNSWKITHFFNCSQALPSPFEKRHSSPSLQSVILFFSFVLHSPFFLFDFPSRCSFVVVWANWLDALYVCKYQTQNFVLADPNIDFFCLVVPFSVQTFTASRNARWE